MSETNSVTIGGVLSADPVTAPPEGGDPLHNPPPAEGEGEAPPAEETPPPAEGGDSFEVPDKFVKDGEVDVRALAESYRHLESKLAGGETPPPAEGEAPPEAGALGDLFTEDRMADYGRAMAETGTLTPEQVETFTANGIPAELVQGAIAHANTQRLAVDTAVVDTMGGRDEFTKVAEWFSKKGTEAELATYNQAVNSGDLAAATTAAEGILAKYRAANGQDPTHRVTGGRQTRPMGIEPYSSMKDAVADMQKPEYQTSPEFRAKVQSRMMRSDIK